MDEERTRRIHSGVIHGHGVLKHPEGTRDLDSPSSMRIVSKHTLPYMFVGVAGDNSSGLDNAAATPITERRVQAVRL